MKIQENIPKSEINTANPGVYPRVAIIILNWNGWLDTIECLESVYQMTYPFYDAIVVDNGSENSSIDKIKEYADGKIHVESPFFTYRVENKPIAYIEYTRQEAEDDGIFGKSLSNVLPPKRLILIKNEKNYGFAEGNNIAIKYVLDTNFQKYILILLSQEEIKTRSQRKEKERIVKNVRKGLGQGLAYLSW